MDLWKKFKNQKTMTPEWQGLEPEDLRLSSVLLFTGYKAIGQGLNLSHTPFHYLQTELKVRWLHRCIVRAKSVLYLKGLCKLKTAVKSSVQSLSHVRLAATPWTAACQASLSITDSLQEDLILNGTRAYLEGKIWAMGWGGNFQLPR